MANTQAAVPQQTHVVKWENMKPIEKMTTLERKLKALLPRFETLLGDKRKAEILMYVALNAVRKNPKLLNCTMESFIGSINHCSDIGLFPNTPDNHAYLIPFATECTVMIDYKGYIELAHQIPKIAKIYAELVYKDDDFRCELGDDPKLHHIPNYEADRSIENLIGAYAVVKFSNGERQWIYMTRKEMDKVRNISKAKDKKDGPWNTWREEMYRKTPLRRLMKFIPSSPKMLKAIELDNAATMGESQHNIGASDDNAVEVYAEVVEETEDNDGENGHPQTKSEEMAQKFNDKKKKAQSEPEPEPEQDKPEHTEEERQVLIAEMMQLIFDNEDKIDPHVIKAHDPKLIYSWSYEAIENALEHLKVQVSGELPLA